MKIDILKATGLFALIGGGLYFYKKSKKSSPMPEIPVTIKNNTTQSTVSTATYSATESQKKALETIAQVNKLLKDNPLPVPPKPVNLPLPYVNPKTSAEQKANVDVVNKNKASQIPSINYNSNLRKRNTWESGFAQVYKDLQNFYSQTPKTVIDKYNPILVSFLGANFAGVKMKDITDDEKAFLVDNNLFIAEEDFYNKILPTFYQKLNSQKQAIELPRSGITMTVQAK